MKGHTKTDEQNNPLCPRLSTNDRDDGFQPRGKNFAVFLRVTSSEAAPLKKKLHTCVTVNLGGPQLPPSIWQFVRSFLDVVCPKRKDFLYSRNASAATSTCQCPASEMPFYIQNPSDSYFGRLRISILSETAIEGDEIYLAHGLEFTAQSFRLLLSSDYAFVHAALGLLGDFRHGPFKCDQCHISTTDLETPWHLLTEKPTIRTKHSMKKCLEVWKDTASHVLSKGVIAEPIFPFAIGMIVPHFVHVFNGIFNKIWDSMKTSLVRFIDEPYMLRSEAAAVMTTRIEELEDSKKYQCMKLAEKKEELALLKQSQVDLQTYLNKFEKTIRNFTSQIKKNLLTSRKLS